MSKRARACSNIWRSASWQHPTSRFCQVQSGVCAAEDLLRSRTDPTARDADRNSDVQSRAISLERAFGDGFADSLCEVHGGFCVADIGGDDGEFVTSDAADDITLADATAGSAIRHRRALRHPMSEKCRR